MIGTAVWRAVFETERALKRQSIPGTARVPGMLFLLAASDRLAGAFPVPR